MQKTREAFEKLRLQINNEEKTHYTIEDVAKGFITVANETMCRPIR
jgi:5-oxoprolinase (ATP-hydrolysing)